MTGRFRLHPWDPDTLYTVTEFDQEPDAEGDAHLDLEFEVPEGEWRPLSPGRVEARTVHFVDGARRHDAAGTLDERPCLFVVMGVGSVTSRLGTRVEPPAPRPAERYVIVAGEDSGDVEPVSLPQYGLTYAPRFAGGGDQSLAAFAQRLMLREEARLAERLAEDHPTDLVVEDGPLKRSGSFQNVLGYVKTTRRERLPGSHHAVLDALEPGQRTPVYLVRAGDRSLGDRLEWVIRPRPPARGVDPRQGLVRVQANSALSRDEARALADWSAATLPRYSADYHHDARAPQQLLIVKNLESDLRRTFGDRELLLGALRGALAA